MATLSLNTSITQSHKERFYTKGGYAPLIYANYWGDYNVPTPCDDFVFELLVNGKWKFVDSIYNCGGYTYAYQSYYFVEYWWKKDEDYYKPIDKIRVKFAGLTAESLLNFAKIKIYTKDKSNVPLKTVEILRTSAIDSQVIVHLCTEDCKIFNDITKVMRECNTSIKTMLSKQMNDNILIGMMGVPSKLTLTVSIAGVHSGSFNLQYWSSSGWKYVSITDKTNGLRNKGTNDILLSPPTDWANGGYVGTNKLPENLYWCRLIFDSYPSVTTVPEISCIRWSGEYVFLTNDVGYIEFDVKNKSTLNITGKLKGYVCVSGCGSYYIEELVEEKEINLVLQKKEVTCGITCPEKTYVYNTEKIESKVVSNVNVKEYIRALKPDGDVEYFGITSEYYPFAKIIVGNKDVTQALRDCTQFVDIVVVDDFTLLGSKYKFSKIYFDVSKPGVYTGSIYMYYWDGNYWALFSVEPKISPFQNAGVQKYSLTENENKSWIKKADDYYWMALFPYANFSQIPQCICAGCNKT